MDFKLEFFVLPVSNVDRAKSFYEKLGWRLDADFVFGEDFRVIQFTPPGSECSVLFGKGMTTATPGSVQGLALVVKDIEAARTEIANRGVDVSEVYHDIGMLYRVVQDGRRPGPDPERRSYSSFADFTDPDGNKWLVQEVTRKAPGR